MTKIIFSDIDETLLHEHTPLHPDNIKAIKKWQRKGNRMVLCTGRNIKECLSSLKRIDMPYDYLILNNGAHILDKEKTLYEKKIKHDIGCAILDITTSIEGMWSYFCDGINNYGYYDGQCYDRNGMDNCIIDKDFKELYHQAGDFQILCFNQDDEKMNHTQSCIASIKTKYSDEVELFINGFYVDVVSQNCSKGKGIEILLDIIDDNIDKTIAIGDSFNDISMFDVVDTAYTFDYADAKVKAKADKIVSYFYECVEEEE